MVFPRTRLLIKIGLIICQICFVLALAAGLILGVVFAIITKQAFMFFIYFGSGIAGAGLIFLFIKFVQWLCKDFEELDTFIKSLRAGNRKLKEEITKQTDEMIVTITEVESPKEEVKVEAPKKEELEKPAEKIAVEQQPKVVHIEKVKDTSLKPGDNIVLNRDFSDYGFEFKKGMQGVFEKETGSNDTASVRMTSGIRGIFRFPKEYLDKDISGKK